MQNCILIATSDMALSLYVDSRTLSKMGLYTTNLPSMRLYQLWGMSKVDV